MIYRGIPSRERFLSFGWLATSVEYKFGVFLVSCCDANLEAYVCFGLTFLL